MPDNGVALEEEEEDPEEFHHHRLRLNTIQYCQSNKNKI